MNLALSIALFVASHSQALTKEQRMMAEVVNLTNQERQHAGLPILKSQADLDRAAAYLANDLAKRQVLEHQDGHGRQLVQRVEADGYREWTAVAENIAYGQRNASEVVRAWMNSPGHRENIMATDYSEIGVGLAYSSGGTRYWVQIFGSR